MTNVLLFLFPSFFWYKFVGEHNYGSWTHKLNKFCTPVPRASSLPPRNIL